MFELQFHPEAVVEITALEPIMKVKLLAKLDKLELLGNQLRYPDTDIIGDGLFELRVGKQNITRTFFAFAVGRKIYILRTFIKKTAKTPLFEIELALKRLGEMTDEN
ncbi:type II toxin-antitoxin system RelE/ParE family toxin [Testudinibacter sp. TR-2022]|uniref:type II toxin-antitoxin system RelE/ParE family toxin n=1 Tax=Testudinibacter sp. TR-2022 TaxID=2585029 RepID=UPI001117D7C9|nr:type II toxin-antitoxin system RelE/ParE family toxin [Testudinibacter sp. TR-2022]TNH03823.1 type II toxin-antitoxin system RelE/ParE family toxin [Pasteurellaceae bacterium Phil31]TNH11588.1 type II toxin-antitoxin system RelE/ParE family toxin [Testudinibacter sp. TR-2022]TNH11766.1 type II toxin-antitoxin system RelE/ParE family toxin [Testudinibacter sp. TR-2022]TNH15723.1 type II toxin-antitoxin system RelE/ParE family toxin [Testudinibacter sp. TR-2022]TNH20370.1 type II toxin-antito